METKKMSNLQQRILASMISIPLAIAAVAFSQDPYLKIIFAFVMSLLAGLGLKEMFTMEKAKELKPNGKTSIIFSIAFIISLIYSPQVLPIVPQLILLGYFVSVFLIYFRDGKEPIINLSATIFAFLYVTMTLAFLVMIANIDHPQQDGRIWLFYLLFVVKATDTAAFFFGKSFGKTPLAPVISPKKTWEGAFFGFLGSIIISIAFAGIPFFFPEARFTLTFGQSIILGALLSIFAQIGDLAESLLKRDAKVKDSSSLPGLGGVVDILDSLVFTAPLMYILLFHVGGLI